MFEERLEKIENKISFQEDLLEELNKIIFVQQNKLQHLEAVCLSLAQQVQSLSEARHDNGILNERPPHY